VKPLLTVRERCRSLAPSIAISVVILALLGLAAAATTPLPLAPAPAPAVVSDQPSATAAFASVPVKTIYVTRLTDAGRGSLRQALERANASKPRGITVVYFRRRGVIRLRHGLPVIRRTVLIDGNSAPTHHLGGPPVVELNCAGHAGLRFGRGANGSGLRKRCAGRPLLFVGASEA